MYYKEFSKCYLLYEPRGVKAYNYGMLKRYEMNHRVSPSQTWLDCTSTSPVTIGSQFVRDINEIDTSQ